MRRQGRECSHDWVDPWANDTRDPQAHIVLRVNHPVPLCFTDLKTYTKERLVFHCRPADVVHLRSPERGQTRAELYVLPAYIFDATHVQRNTRWEPHLMSLGFRWNTAKGEGLRGDVLVVAWDAEAFLRELNDSVICAIRVKQHYDNQEKTRRAYTYADYFDVEYGKKKPDYSDYVDVEYDDDNIKFT